MIDELPEAELEALEEWLRARRRQGQAAGSRSITNEEFHKFLDEAPLDDEPETEEELEAIRRWRSKPGETISHEEVLKQLGFE